MGGINKRIWKRKKRIQRKSFQKMSCCYEEKKNNVKKHKKKLLKIMENKSKMKIKKHLRISFCTGLMNMLNNFETLRKLL